MHKYSKLYLDFESTNPEKREIFMLIDNTETNNYILVETKKWLDKFTEFLFDKAVKNLS